MKFKALLAVAFLVAVSLFCFAPCEENEATITNAYIEQGSSITVDADKPFTITVHYTNDVNTTKTVKVIDTSNGSTVWEDRIQFNVGEYSFDINLTSDMIKSSAPIYMKITFENGVYKDLYFTLNYTTSIWSNGAIYVAIIVIVILVIALVVFKSRMAPKATKNTLTFEQIEAQRQSEKAAPVKKSAPVKTERQKYLESKKKN